MFKSVQAVFQPKCCAPKPNLVTDRFWQLAQTNQHRVVSWIINYVHSNWSMQPHPHLPKYLYKTNHSGLYIQLIPKFGVYYVDANKNDSELDSYLSVCGTLFSSLLSSKCGVRAAYLVTSYVQPDARVIDVEEGDEVATMQTLKMVLVGMRSIPEHLHCTLLLALFPVISHNLIRASKCHQTPIHAHTLNARE